MRSVSDTEIHHNDLTFNEITAIEMTPESPAAFARLRSDWNNFGTQFREPLPSEREAISDDHRSLSPKERPLSRTRSKFLVRVHDVAADRLPGNAEPGGSWRMHRYAPDDLRFHSLVDWQRASLKDRHSVFVDPSYRDPLARDYRPSSTSPVVGSGQGGSTIGAFGRLPGDE